MSVTDCSGALFNVQCLNNLVINVIPTFVQTQQSCSGFSVQNAPQACLSKDYLGQLSVDTKKSYTPDPSYCYKEKYPALSIGDLFVSPKGSSAKEAKCEAHLADDDGKTLFGDKDLKAKVTDAGFFFDAAECGTTNDLDTKDDTLKNDGLVKFSAYLQSNFPTDAGSVLTNTEMLETEILCQYKDVVDGIGIPINTDLDNVEAEKKVTNDAEEKEIDAGEVTTKVQVNSKDYNPTDKNAPAITLGSKVSIEFSAIGELTEGYYIESCTATDTDDDTKDVQVELIKAGCVEVTGANYAAIGTTFVDDKGAATTAGGTKVEFNQFAFVKKDSDAADPTLEFQLSCILKFGTAPDADTCKKAQEAAIAKAKGESRRRRSNGISESSYIGDGKEAVSVEPFNVSAGESYSVNGGVATAQKRENTESGATEMLISAYAAAAFLLL